MESMNSKYFNEAFRDENDTGEQLKDYEALLIMRERTKNYQVINKQAEKTQVYYHQRNEK